MTGKQGAFQSMRDLAPAENRQHQSPSRWGHYMINRLTDSLNFQTEALVMRAERQRMIACNIANADTPG